MTLKSPDYFSESQPCSTTFIKQYWSHWEIGKIHHFLWNKSTLYAINPKTKGSSVSNTCLCLDRQGFQVGSLSHMINLKAGGYQELPEFPEVAPDPSVRNVEVSLFVITCKNLWYQADLQYSRSSTAIIMVVTQWFCSLLIVMTLVTAAKDTSKCS